MTVEVQNATALSYENIQGSNAGCDGWLDLLAKPYEQERDDFSTFSHVRYFRKLPRELASTQEELEFKVIDLSLYLEQKSYIDNALEHLSLFYNMEDGWDGDDGVAPSIGTIEDAHAVLQMWPTSLGEPVVEPDDDGHIVVNAFSSEGLITACIEFVGENSAIFIGMKDADLVFSKCIKTNDQTAIINTYKTLTKELAAQSS